MQAGIVGVVGHVKQWGLDGDAKSTIEAQFYFPFMQLPDQIMRLAATGVSVVLRTKGNPAAAMGPVRKAVEEIDSREVIYNVITMDEVVANSFAAPSFSLLLLTMFPPFAPVLASL